MDKESQSENEFLKETAPLLFGKKIEADVTPPEGYFDGLPGKMSARIAAEFPEKEKPRGLLRRINFLNIAAAAAVALVLALVPVIRNLTQTPAADHGVAEAITAEEAEAYFNWLAEGEEFYAFLGNDFEIGRFADLSFTDEMTDDDFENYLIREGITIEEIIAVMDEDIHDY